MTSFLPLVGASSGADTVVMHPFLIDRLAQDHWESLGRLAAVDASARRARRSRPARGIRRAADALRRRAA